MTQQEADERVKQAMRDVALEDKADTQVMHLSGGMKRKLCIAIAFAGDSNVIILDEPTSGMVSCFGFTFPFSPYLRPIPIAHHCFSFVVVVGSLF